MQACLEKLRQLGIPHECHNHAAPVMTAEAQTADLKGVEGAVTKNLFLKDKRGRLYIITAAADTKVDLKTLSARLGVGKGGIRMAPDELIGEVLGVPLGSVTPLAVAQPGAANVVLLLDAKLKSAQQLFVHPLDNSASVSLAPSGLEAFLTSLGREARYADLEAEVVIDRDNPPDLKAFAESFQPSVASGSDAAAAAAGAAAAAPVAKPAPAAAPAGGSSKQSGKQAATAAAAKPSQPRADVHSTTEMVVGKALAALGSSTDGIDADVLRRLKADVEAELAALRNAAYASGFAAARGGILAAVSREFA